MPGRTPQTLSCLVIVYMNIPEKPMMDGRMDGWLSFYINFALLWNDGLAGAMLGWKVITSMFECGSNNVSLQEHMTGNILKTVVMDRRVNS